MTSSHSWSSHRLHANPRNRRAFPAGLNNGVFIGFHGKNNQTGLANEENAVVFYDLATEEYFHFISNNEPNVSHLDGLLATADSLFVSHLANGSLFSPTGGSGSIDQIQVIPEPCAMTLLALAGGGLLTRRRR